MKTLCAKIFQEHRLGGKPCLVEGGMSPRPPWYLIKMKKELSKLILKSRQGTLFLRLKVHDA
jgi:hypothetical protein